MQSENISFNYSIILRPDKLTLEELRLRDEAIVAAKSAYAPYSNFFVGAAVLFDDGSIILGNNQENGAYPSGLCAERVALFAAQSSFPTKKIVKMAIIAIQNNEITCNPITPCGACRQVINESVIRQGRSFKLLMFGKERSFRLDDVTSLLPLPFVL